MKYCAALPVHAQKVKAFKQLAGAQGLVTATPPPEAGTRGCETMKHTAQRCCAGSSSTASVNPAPPVSSSRSPRANDGAAKGDWAHLPRRLLLPAKRTFAGVGGASVQCQRTNPLTRERAAREAGASGIDGVTR
jgi:hypothetical protein